MICPHCHKPIRNQKISAAVRKQVYHLHTQGYSARDIQEKVGISFSSAARIVREINAKKRNNKAVEGGE